MYTNKKVISLLVLVVFSFTLLLAGCGTKDGAAVTSSAGETAASAETTAAPTKAELEPVTLTWYVPGGEPLEKALVEEEMSKQVKESLNATISLNWVDFGNYANKLNVMLSSGDDLDLCFTASWLSNHFYQNVSKGAFADLSEILNTKTVKLKEAVPEAFWKAVTIDKKVMAVPNIQPTALQLGAIVNKAMAEKYGFVDKIKTEEDLIKYRDTVVEGEKDNKAIQPWNFRAMTFNEMYGKYDIMKVHDFAVIDMKGDLNKVVSPFEMETFKTYLKEQRELFTKGLIRKDVLAYQKNGDQREADYKAGKSPIGGYGDYGPNMLNPLRKVMGTPGDSIYYDIGFKKYLSNDAITATLTAVNRNSKNPERALMLLELINTDQKLYNTMCYGVEGKHFNLEDGRLVQTEEGKKNYNPGTNWAFGMTKNAYFRKDDPQWLIDMIPEWDTKDVIPSPVMGFTFNPEPVKTEMSKLQTVIDEYYSALCYGTVDPDKVLPEFVQKLKNAGLDKVVSETQAQIDAWKSAQ